MHFGYEDVNYVVRFFSFDRCALACLHYAWPPNVESMDFHQWLSWIFDNNTTVRHIEIAFTIWVWHARNKLCNEGKNQGVRDLVTFLGVTVRRSLLYAPFFLVHLFPLLPNGYPPISPWVKINVDARVYSCTTNNKYEGYNTRSVRGL